VYIEKAVMWKKSYK